MANHRIEIGLRFELGLDGSNELIQTAKAVELFPVAELGSVEGNAQVVEGLIVGLQRDRKRMAVFAAVGERKTRGIVETAWGPMNDFGNQREGLKRARTELVQQQKLGKIVKLAVVGKREYGAEALEIDIRATDFMARRQLQITRIL